ncbi:MAG: NUDIX domain-containing protein [Candidatus Thorarchaeota archaeon]
MTKIIPIVITILSVGEKFLFLKRRNPPYENLWSLVGGKVNPGEHIFTAAKREVMEETGSAHVYDYSMKGVVSERLVKPDGGLEAQFLIFVGDAKLDSFSKTHDEGVLSLFTLNDLEMIKNSILPSDWEMFSSFRSLDQNCIRYYEAELVHDEGNYTLNYYRDGLG